MVCASSGLVVLLGEALTPHEHWAGEGRPPPPAASPHGYWAGG